MFFGSIPRGSQLELALWWAGRGVPVFPCYPKTKKPCTKNGFKDASIDEEQIRYWWGELPHALVSAPTGEASGFDVVDADRPKKGEALSAEEALDGFRSQYDAPNTATCSTMNHGLHSYYKHRPGVKNSQRKYAPQIDTRGEGGFVVLAGNPGYEVVHDCELAEFPVLVRADRHHTNGHALNGKKKSPLDIEALIEAAHKPGAWHESMVLATAHLHSRGTPHSVIIDMLAGRVTCEGFTIEQTRTQLAEMLRGPAEKVANGEWDPPKRANGNGKVCFPDRGPKGKLLPSYANARAALLSCEEFAFSYERFADRAFYKTGELITDEIISAMRQGIIDSYGFDPGLERTFEAARQLAWENSHDRVADWLAGLEWDGTERLSSWLSDYLGAAETALHAAMGRKTLIAAVRRVRRPGCKFDNVLTLIGPQFAGKSLIIRILAGEDALFTDQDLLHAGSSREQQEIMQGRWLCELAELAGWGTAELERIKALITRTHDRARPAYGRATVDQPRRCIFIATTNKGAFLRDSTGNRRWWPVEIGDISLAALERDRVQLWAEAAHAEAGGESLVLPAELWGEAAQAQEERMEDDPWTELLSSLRGADNGEEERVSYAQCADVLSIPKERQTRAFAARLTEVMMRLGWTRCVKAIWLGGKAVKGFSRISQVGYVSQEKTDQDQSTD